MSHKNAIKTKVNTIRTAAGGWFWFVSFSGKMLQAVLVGPEHLSVLGFQRKSPKTVEGRQAHLAL